VVAYRIGSPAFAQEVEIFEIWVEVPDKQRRVRSRRSADDIKDPPIPIKLVVIVITQEVAANI
jgi:hypothetical protein